VWRPFEPAPPLSLRFRPKVPPSWVAFSSCVVGVAVPSEDGSAVPAAAEDVDGDRDVDEPVARAFVVCSMAAAARAAAVILARLVRLWL